MVCGAVTPLLQRHSRVAPPGPYGKLIGTWVMDSTNGPDDNGLPKSEILVFARAAAGLRITATEDDGQGAGTSAFDCATGRGQTTSASGTSTQCTLRPMGDSVLYALDIRHGDSTIATERGRLVVLAAGHVLRDQYDATEGSRPATHHRHIYSRAKGSP